MSVVHRGKRATCGATIRTAPVVRADDANRLEPCLLSVRANAATCSAMARRPAAVPAGQVRPGARTSVAHRARRAICKATTRHRVAVPTGAVPRDPATRAVRITTAVMGSPTRSTRDHPKGCCPANTKISFRWHYSGNSSGSSWSSGSWSSTYSNYWGKSWSSSQQAMEGSLKVNPGSSLKVGYDLSVPGNSSNIAFTVNSPSIVFTVRCVYGSPTLELVHGDAAEPDLRVLRQRLVPERVPERLRELRRVGDGAQPVPRRTAVAKRGRDVQHQHELRLNSASRPGRRRPGHAAPAGGSESPAGALFWVGPAYVWKLLERCLSRERSKHVHGLDDQTHGTDRLHAPLR